jgi:hypothetical protein
MRAADGARGVSVVPRPDPAARVEAELPPPVFLEVTKSKE